MISKCHIDRRALEIRKPEIGQGDMKLFTIQWPNNK